MLAFALLSATPAGAAADEVRPFEEVGAKAAHARQANDFPEAIRLYREAVRLRPGWAEGLWYIGSLLYQEDRYADAIPAFTRFLKLEEKSAPGWTMLGLCEFEMKQYDAALKHLLLGSAPSQPDGDSIAQVARYHRALLDVHFGQFQAALDELKRFTFPADESPGIIQATGLAALDIPLMPDELPPGKHDIVARTGRAVLDSWAARSAEADREFRELLVTWPADDHVHYLYGSFLLRSDPDNGLRELEKCLELNPKYVPAMLQTAFEYLSRRDVSRGIPWAERAVGLEPDSFVAHNALGRLLLAGGQFERSIRELETAVRLAPENPECRFALGSAYTKAGRTAEAARERAEFLRLKQLRGAPEDK